MDTGGRPFGEPDKLEAHERLRIIFVRMHALPAFRDAEEALAALRQVVTAVEDEFSGVPAEGNPGLEYHGRLYPPKEDRIVRNLDGSIEAETRGHLIRFESNGAVTIRRKRGSVEFEKAGHVEP
jgi:hypothetical protein